MKTLLEVLAKHLNEWHSDAHSIGQACGGQLHLNERSGALIRHTEEFYPVKKNGSYFAGAITKEQWQAEREKLNKPKEKSVSKDGWIRHRGGKCKVGGDVMVEYRMRYGDTGYAVSSSLDWIHRASEYDIMAFKVCKGDCEIDESFEEAKAESKAIADEQASFDALCIRDEIKERKAEIEVNQKRIAELVEKLRSEGFALIDGGVVEPEEDMRDPKNWKAGDVVEATNSSSYGFTNGSLYSLLDDGVSEWGSVLIAEDDEGYHTNGWNPEYFKFHHRPK